MIAYFSKFVHWLTRIKFKKKSNTCHFQTSPAVTDLFSILPGNKILCKWDSKLAHTNTHSYRYVCVCAYVFFVGVQAHIVSIMEKVNFLSQSFIIALTKMALFYVIVIFKYHA